MEGPLRPPARPRARARRAGAAHRRRHRAPPPPGRRARRDAHRAHRREPALRRGEPATANGNGHTATAEELEQLEVEDEDEDSTLVVEIADAELPEEPEQDDPGAVRRYRFRHPTASGKTIAAAGFVEAARTLGVLILTHRRLLVSQFTRDLTTEGYGKRLTDVITRDSRSAKKAPLTIQTYAWFARHVDEIDRDAYQLVICDEAHTALGEKTSAAIRSFPEPHLHRHDGDRAADREAGLRRLPRLGRRPAAAGRRAPRPDRAAARPARAAGRGDQLGADRRRRLRPGDPRQDARPPGAEPGRREPLPRPLRQHAGHRLRGRSRPRLQPRDRSSARPG